MAFGEKTPQFGKNKRRSKRSAFEFNKKNEPTELSEAGTLLLEPASERATNILEPTQPDWEAIAQQQAAQVEEVREQLDLPTERIPTVEIDESDILSFQDPNIKASDSLDFLVDTEQRSGTGQRLSQQDQESPLAQSEGRQSASTSTQQEPPIFGEDLSAEPSDRATPEDVDTNRVVDSWEDESFRPGALPRDSADSGFWDRLNGLDNANPQSGFIDADPESSSFGAYQLEDAGSQPVARSSERQAGDSGFGPLPESDPFDSRDPEEKIEELQRAETQDPIQKDSLKNILKYSTAEEFDAHRQDMETAILHIAGLSEAEAREEYAKLSLESADYFRLPQAIAEQMSGRLILVQPLADQGAQGSVFRSFDTRLRIWTVTKLAVGAMNENRKKRFQQEMVKTAQLNNPHIIRVYDGGATEAGGWYTMENLPGGNLYETVFSSEQVPTDQVLNYAYQLADGMAAVHEAGIVHRDLKPENVFIDAEGQLRIADFGLVKQMTADQMKEYVVKEITSGRLKPSTLNPQASERLSKVSSRLREIKQAQKAVESSLARPSNSAELRSDIQEKRDEFRQEYQQLASELRKIAEQVSDQEIDSAFAKAMAQFQQNKDRWLSTALKDVDAGVTWDQGGRHVPAYAVQLMRQFVSKYSIENLDQLLIEADDNDEIIQDYQEILRYIPDEHISVSQTGAIIGTPMYMSPEQLRAQASLNTKSDVWALGVMLHEMTTSERLFNGRVIGAVVAQVFQKQIPELASLRDDIPKEFSDLVASMLNRDPNQRPSMEEIKKTLASIIVDQRKIEPPEPKKEPGFLSRLASRFSRNSS